MKQFDWSTETIHKMHEAIENKLNEYKYKLKPSDLDSEVNRIMTEACMYIRCQLDLYAKHLNNQKKEKDL